MSRVRVLGVPIDSVGGRIGTVFGPGALRSAGVVDALDAEDLGDLDVLIEPPERDPRPASSAQSRSSPSHERCAR